MPNNIGMLVTAPIRPQSSLDKFPSAFQNEIRGGFHQVADITERNLISTDRRQIGMWAKTTLDGKIWELVGGVENANWQEVIVGNETHNHDDLYYTETEIDNQMASKAGVTHNHDAVYYTETEIDAKLADYSLNGHVHGNAHDSTLIGTKLVDETSIGDGKVLKYNESTGKIEYAVSATGTGGDAGEVAYMNPDEPTVLDVKDALDILLYKPIAINNFSNSVGTIEKGNTITDVTFNWSVSKTPTTQIIGSGVGAVAVGTTNKTITGQAISADTSYTLSVSDGKTTPTSTTSVLFRSKRYWGTNANPNINDAQMLLLNKEFATTRSKSFILNGNGEYIYFAYPESFGDAVIKVNGLNNTAWTKTVRDFNNASGFTESYIIYNSDTVQNGINIEIQVV